MDHSQIHNSIGSVAKAAPLTEQPLTNLLTNLLVCIILYIMCACLYVKPGAHRQCIWFLEIAFFMSGYMSVCVVCPLPKALITSGVI